MNPADDILDAKQLCFEGDFHSQVNHILQQVRLTRDEVENLTHLFDDLEGVLQRDWPGCQVHPFGSIVTGLGIKTSDVDCYIAMPAGLVPKRNYVTQARNRLRCYRHIFAELFAITTAKVPIVKFLHVPTQRHCDVNFKSPSGVRNSKLTAYLLRMDIRALNLAILVKYWSKVHHFTGTNLMPNYALTILVVFYLQQMNILPSIYQLQKHVENHMVDNWNTAFDDTFGTWIKNDESLYSLLGGFFKYYSDFKFEENIVSPFMGYAINRKVFENFNTIPDAYDLYKRNFTEKLCRQLRLDTYMCIQDPFEHDRNCAVAMYPKLVTKVIAHFKFAARKFEEDKNDNFLNAMLTEDPYIAALPVITKEDPKTPTVNIQKAGFRNKVMKNNHKALKRNLQNALHIWHMDTNRVKRGKR